MSATLSATVAVGAFVVGLVVGHLVARRGRAVAVDWRLQIRSTDDPGRPDDT